MSFPMSFPASAVVYKVGTTYKAVEKDGKVFKHDTDAANVINSALDRVSDSARTWGGRVFIYSGDYTCLTSVDMTQTTHGVDGLELVGEGPGTNLMWTPGSALAYGILLQSSKGRLASMRLYGNANVAKIVHNQGRPSADANQSYFTNFDHLLVDGTPTGTTSGSTYYSSSGLPTAGQTGIYVEGVTPGTPDITRPCFFYTFSDCQFRGLDIGLHYYGSHATSAMINNCGSWHNETAFKLSGGQNHLSNIWIQGAADCGTWGVYCTPESGGTGSRTSIANLTAEIHKTGTVCAAVYTSTSTASTRLVNVINDYDNGYEWHTILDESGIVDMPNLHLLDIVGPLHMTRWRTGSWHAGSTPPTKANGMLAGNIVEPSAGGSITMVSASNYEYARRYQTSSTINSVKGLYYNYNSVDGVSAGTGTYTWNWDAYPKLWGRWLFNTNTSIRFFFGFTSRATAPVTTADPLANLKGVGIFIDTGVSSNMQAICNNGTATSSLTSLGAGIPTTGTAGVYGAKIYCNRDDDKIGITYYYNNDQHAYATLSTNVPVDNSGAMFQMYIENIAASTKAFDLLDLYVEHRA